MMVLCVITADSTSFLTPYYSLWYDEEGRSVEILNDDVYDDVSSYFPAYFSLTYYDVIIIKKTLERVREKSERRTFTSLKS